MSRPIDQVARSILNEPPIDALCDWLLQSQREEERYGVSRMSKRGADYEFEF